MSEFSPLTDALWERCIRKADKDGQYAVAAALFQMAKAINDLGFGTAYHPGAIEGHTMKMMESISELSSSIESIAEAIKDREFTS